NLNYDDTKIVYFSHYANYFSLFFTSVPPRIRSVCPSGLWGATRSRTSRFKATISGNPLSAFRSTKSSPSTKMRNSPAVSAGFNSMPLSSSANVVSSSDAMYDARSSQPHFGQYVMVIVGFIFRSHDRLFYRQLLGHLAGNVEECGPGRIILIHHHWESVITRVADTFHQRDLAKERRLKSFRQAFAPILAEDVISIIGQLGRCEVGHVFHHAQQGDVNGIHEEHTDAAHRIGKRYILWGSNHNGPRNGEP